MRLEYFCEKIAYFIKKKIFMNSKFLRIITASLIVVNIFLIINLYFKYYFLYSKFYIIIIIICEPPRPRATWIRAAAGRRRGPACGAASRSQTGIRHGAPRRRTPSAQSGCCRRRHGTEAPRGREAREPLTRPVQNDGWISIIKHWTSFFWIFLLLN